MYFIGPKKGGREGGREGGRGGREGGTRLYHYQQLMLLYDVEQIKCNVLSDDTQSVYNASM